MSSLPAHATILVYTLSPLLPTHAIELIQSIKSYKSNSISTTNLEEMNWIIKNKYYEVKVGFKLIKDDDKVLIEESNNEPALIILIPRDEKPSKVIERLLSNLSKRENEFEIALLVTYPITTSTTTTNTPTTINEDSYEDLALDNGFEWVDINPLQPKEQEDEEEENGIGRIVNALHAHLWEGMIRTERKATSSGSKERNMEEDEEQEEELNLGIPPLPSPRPFIPIELNFPNTFLPSLIRTTSASPTTTTTTSKTKLSSNTTQVSKSNSKETSFEDDFSPFVPPLSSSTFPSLTSTSTSTSTTSTSIPSNSRQKNSSLSLVPSLSNLEIVSGGLEEEEEEEEVENEDDSLSNTSSRTTTTTKTTTTTTVGEEEVEEEEEEDLSILLSKLIEFKRVQEGLGLEERRNRVEELMKEF